MILYLDNKDYLYNNLEEYLEIIGIPKDHPNMEAYKILWTMARTKIRSEENKEGDKK